MTQTQILDEESSGEPYMAIDQDDKSILTKSSRYYKVEGEHLKIDSGVTRICDEVFHQRYDFSCVSIAKSVRFIGERAFAYCSNLAEINLSENLEHMGNAVFANTGLTHIALPDGIRIIRRCTFFRCSELTEVTIPSSVITIERWAFAHCSSLRTITIPASVQNIGRDLFKGCSQLDFILCDNPELQAQIKHQISTLGLSAEVISSEEHKNMDAAIRDGCSRRLSSTSSAMCVNLADCTPPDYITLAIRDGYNRGLLRTSSNVDSAHPGDISKVEGKRLKINSDVIAIGDEVFYDRHDFSCVSIADSVRTIGARAFAYCSNLAEINLSENLEDMGDAVFANTDLTQVTLPSGITMIPISTFYGCSKLTKVTIPSSVITIKGWAFAYCSSLRIITIPASVRDIGRDLFEGCSQLDVIVCDNPKLQTKIKHQISTLGLSAKVISSEEHKNMEAAIRDGCARRLSSTFYKINVDVANRIFDYTSSSDAVHFLRTTKNPLANFNAADGSNSNNELASRPPGN